MRNFIALTVLVLNMISCGNNDNYLGNDIRLFKGKSWELAKAVEKEDIKQIKDILKQNKIYVDYQEAKYGRTLLMWAVIENKYKSAKELLEQGANPDLQDEHEKTSALMFAADKHETSKYVKLLLDYGGDPNAVSEKCLIYRCTPLIAASKRNLESVKILVKSGANIDFRTTNGQTALDAATTSSKVDIAYYLIIEKGADFKRPIGKTIDGNNIYIVDNLRRCVFPLDSKEYAIKMKIVKYMLEKGVNYWETPIPKHYYNNYDSAYLEKY